VEAIEPNRRPRSAGVSSKTARSGPKVTRITAGTYVFREGELGTEMFVVRSGRIEIQKRGPSGDQLIAALEKGDPFGEMVVLDDVSYGVSAVATQDSELVRLNRAMFDRVLRGNPEIAVRIMRKLTARIRSLELQLAGESERGDGADGAAPTSDTLCAFVTPDDERLTFKIGVNTVVGREDPVTGLSPGVDLTPIDPERSSSRQHARLFAEEGRYFLSEDIGTTNGTFVNDTQLKPGVAVEIVPGDQVRFGLVQVKFLID